MTKIYLTFDLEEWRIPEHNKVQSKYNAETSFSYKGTLKLLKILKKYKVKATFFVTGYFAEKEPDLVKMISKQGHEIASHSYKDVNHNELNPKGIRKFIKKTTRLLKKITGKNPLGFRTPQFSINNIILREIIKESYKYDSSIHPTHIPKYNNAYPKKLEPYLLKTKQRIKEIPVSVMPFIREPLSWIWMRNIGFWWTNLGVKLNLKANRDVVLYFHPWEFVKLPSIKGVPFYITRKCGDKFLGKVEELIKSFKNYEFGLMKELK